MEFTKEYLSKAEKCKSVAELQEPAKSEGIELTIDAGGFVCVMVLKDKGERVGVLQRIHDLNFFTEAIS